MKTKKEYVRLFIRIFLQFRAINNNILCLYHKCLSVPAFGRGELSRRTRRGSSAVIRLRRRPDGLRLWVFSVSFLLVFLTHAATAPTSSRVVPC